MTSMWGPAALDTQSLEFRQLCKLQTVNDNTKNLYKNRTNLVASCSLYGLIFVGEKSGVKVIVSSKLYEDSHVCNAKNVLQAYIHRNIALPSPPTHIDVNSDQKVLSVTFILNETPVLLLYSIESFFTPNVIVMNEVRLSSVSGTRINDLAWNPGNPAMLACCISDGTLTIYTFGPGSNVAIKSLPKESNSTCACWSPKGKQIAVGNINGYLTQYTPELKAVKNYAPPSNVFTKPCTITSLKWLSPFQFIGVYSDQQQYVSNDEEIKTYMIVVNTPKNGAVSYISYEDICYSSGTTRPNQFYFLHVAQWNVVFVASANAIEVGVLSLSTEENVWYQWNLDESARVILPMNKTEETFPVGVAVDYSSQIQTPIGDALLPMPVFVVLTNEGLLCLYVINNFGQNTPCICVKPNPIPSLQCFTNNAVTDQASNQQQQQQPQQQPQQLPQQTPVSPVISATPVSTPPVQQVPASIAPQFGFTSNNQQPVSTPISFNTAALGAHMSNMFAGMPLMNSQVNFSSASVKITSESTTFSTINQQGQSQTVIVKSSIVKNDDSKIPQTPKTSKYPEITSQPSTPVLQIPTEDASQKAANLQKLREEALKKLKKRASTFENEIQTFKTLTSSLQVDTETRPCDKIISQFEAKSKKLEDLNDSIRNKIDNLKTSIIEVTACVKDIKSQQFLLTNPGYRSLSSAQDLDSASVASLKNIEKNIYYVQSQIELADKQLDDMWYKFCENSPESTTKAPKLENIYRTIVVQQKILKGRKLEMQSLEKKLKEMRYRMSLVQPHSSGFENDYSIKSYDNLTAKEDVALAELTKKVLSLDSDSKSRVDANSVSEKCLKEYAKRYTLSTTKQVKLQELHGTHTVNYIRSAKLQRMKKKSLIILSKSTNISEISPSEVKASPHANEVLRQQLISPVSSDDGVSDKVSVTSIPTAIEKAAASTPVKGGTSVKLNAESTFAEEPSVIAQLPDEPPKLEPEIPQVVLSLPSSISAFRINKPTSETATVEKPPLFVTSKPNVDKENVAQPVRQVMPSGVTFGSLNQAFHNSSPVQPSTIGGVSSAPLISPFFGVKPTTSGVTSTTASSFFGGLKLAPSTTPAPLNLTSGTVTSSLFGQNLASSVATNMNALRDVTGSLNFGQKNDALKSATSTAQTTVPSLFASKPSQAAVSEVSTVTTAAPVVVSGSESEGLFKIASSTSSSSLVSVIAATTAPPVTVSATATAPVITGSSSLFGKSIFSTPPASSVASATTTASIFANSSIFGKPSSTEGVNFATPLTSTNSLFSAKPATSVTPSADADKKNVFVAFSFAKQTPTTSTVTISEIPSEDAAEAETNAEAATSAINTFSFASATVKSEPSSEPSVTITPVSTPSFGSPSTPANPVSTSVMVTPTASTTAVTSTPTTSAFSGSFFGGLSLTATTTTTTSTGSVFGKPTPTSSVFGTNVFSQQANVTPASSTETKSIFGSGPLFGQANAANQENKSIFGQTNVANQAPKSIFGQSTVANQENKPLFGQTQGNFQSTGGSSLFGSGGGSSIFGGGSVFSGGTAAAITQANTFGSSGGSLFGSGSFTNASATSSFQGTAGGFGSPPSFSNTAQPQQSAAGFGSPPAFSSAFKPGNQFSAFGSAPTFGGSPTFGASPTKLFGQNTPTMGGFGSAAQQPTAFDNLANENTMTFGNLAQQQQSPGFGSPPSFGAGAQQSPPSFGGSSFGGQSFSSWR